MGALGQQVENCKTLKHKIQDLINCMEFTFVNPNVGTNHMSAHAGALANAIKEVVEDNHGVIIIPV